MDTSSLKGSFGIIILMLNRERFLLAIIDELGKQNRGENRIEKHVEKLLIQKILFLFSKEKSPNFSFYGFFPYKFGPYSYKIEMDLSYFQEKGFITENFLLTESGKSNIRITPTQQQYLIQTLKNYPTTKNLVDFIYQKYPEYTIRSQAINVKPEVKQPDFSPSIFLIGYENRLVDDFINILIQLGISILVDVRNNPVSMNYDYNRTYLERITKLGKIQYLNFKELGVPSQIRKQLKTNDNQLILDYYKVNILPKQNSLIDKLIEMGQESRIALLCYERDYLQCHRSIIGDLLQKKGCKVEIIQ